MVQDGLSGCQVPHSTLFAAKFVELKHLAVTGFDVIPQIFGKLRM
jgi:hypothetical protein